MAFDNLLKDDLSAALAAGEKVNWGHQPQRDGALGPGCLSQWWPSPFRVNGTEYPTAEHWMMVEKAKLFGDQPAANEILAAPSPAAAKALGQQVAGFNENLWVEKRFQIVVRGSVEKFGQSKDLRAYLVGTGNRVLVEASPRDRIWGNGLAATHEDAKEPRQWPGLNLLGFALMEARAILLTS
jgi:ribA/ribD-fused uncharacterized protein